MTVLRARGTCAERGCYIEQHHPRWEEFDGLFPRGISITDVDGLVEMGGHFLMLEWKTGSSQVPKGQDMLLSRFATLSSHTEAWVVWGDAKTTEPVKLKRYDGASAKEYPMNKEIFTRLLKQWGQRAEGRQD